MGAIPIRATMWLCSSTDRIIGYEPVDRGSIPCGATKYGVLVITASTSPLHGEGLGSIPRSSTNIMEKEPSEEIPHVVEITPELELAWRGLVISIKEGQIDRKKAIEMLQEWACSSEAE